MSWFDTAGFASFAKSALTSAQKTIDKALDIQEDTVQSTARLSQMPVPLSPDIDFFEAYGLNQIPQPRNVPSTSKMPASNEKRPIPSSSSQNSGFWTDTWGSFFETKAAVPNVQQQPVTSSELKPASANLKKSITTTDEKVTVSSQPQRASLFPSGIETETLSSQKSSSIDELKQIDVPIITKDEPVISGDSKNSGEDVTKSLESVSTLSDKTDTISALLDTESLSNKDDLLRLETFDEIETCRENKNEVILSQCTDQVVNQINEQQLEKSDDQASSINQSPVHKTSNVFDDSMSPTANPMIISESFVDLEGCDVNKLNTASSNTTSSVDEDSSVQQSSNTEPKQLSDSYQILSESIIQHENAWVMDVVDDCTVQLDDHESRSGDSGSNSSGKDDGEVDIKSLGSSQSHDMLNSFVKCSLDDIDYVCHRGQSPLSTTASERSDLTKLESEQNTSGDENETTTSSDIEVLSPPNGESNERNASPLKHIWLPRNVCLRGSESPSSDCSNMAAAIADSERLSEIKSGIFYFKSEKDSSLKRYEGIDLDKMFQHQEELQALLEAREKKVMDLSTENLQLHEEEEKLQNNVRELKLSLTKESQNVSNITKDLTQKVARIENNMLAVSKERDELKKRLMDAQHEMVQRISYNQMEETIKEKDQQIKELMDEGQKLSKKELQHLTIIKKLRAKEEEMEHSSKSLKERVEENSKEVERLRKSLSAKDEQEKTHIDAIRQLSNSVNKLEKEIITLNSNLEDSTEKELTSKKSLESTFKELTGLQKSSAMKDKEIKELKLSVEMAAKEKLKEGLDQANREANRERQMLLTQMEDLRNSLKKCHEETTIRETSLRADIARLQLCLQESETRNQELTKNISTTSRPLVRQIESLQASYNAQISAYEKIEKSLTDRLNDSQNQLSIAVAKEKLANEKYQGTVERMRKLEMQNNSLLQENVQLSTVVEVTNSKIAILEDSENLNVSTIDSVKNSLTEELNKLKEEKNNIAKELENCVELLKEERQLNQNLQEELRHKESKCPSVENISPCFSPNTSLRSSVESVNNWAQEDIREKNIPIHVGNVRLSVYDTLTRTGCTTSILENLQSQLKQREGEISQLQCEILKLERERESVAQELVTITTENEELSNELDKLKSVEKLHKDLSQKYNALLQMYNEKVDEYEALQLDLSDVKSAYRKQIEELMQDKT